MTETPGHRPAPPEAGLRERVRTGNLVPEQEVAAMFDDIAPVYDRMNTIMTAGLDGRWRRAAVAATGIGPGDRAIDVACGTGKLAAALAERVGPNGRVVGVDLAPDMVELAAASHPDLPWLTFQLGNALELPFDDGEFDAATIAFGLRNLADFEAGFRELGRVVRPGGLVVCLELSVPRPFWWGTLFHKVFRLFAPAVGSMFGQRAAYAYLPASLDGFPQPAALARTMAGAGLVGVSFRRLALGTVALHRGRVPAAPVEAADRD